MLYANLPKETGTTRLFARLKKPIEEQEKIKKALKKRGLMPLDGMRRGKAYR